VPTSSSRGRPAQQATPQQATPQQQVTAVTRVDPATQRMVASRDALRTELQQQLAIMAATAAGGMDATKMAGVALTHFTRNPTLWDCTPVSIARCIVEAAQYGLEPIFGNVYLVPFQNRKSGQREAQLIIGYRGLITLARRSGEVRRVWAEVVRAKDEFRYQRGLHPDLHHVPYQPAPGTTGDDLDPGPMTHAYSVAEFRDGERQFDVMTAAEVYAIRARSKGAFYNGSLTGPWLTDEAEMSKKTVTRRLSKSLPLTIEARHLLDAEDAGEREAQQAAPAQPSRAQQLAAQVRGSLGAGRDVPSDTTTPSTAGGSDDPASSDSDAAPDQARMVGTSDSGSTDQPDAGGAAEGDGQAGAHGGGQARQPTGEAPAQPTCSAPSPYREGEACVVEPRHEGPHEDATGATWL
jgi:recombination protein RecT